MRDCQNCKHLIMYDYKNKSYSCEKWECEFEPKEQEPTVEAISKADYEARLKENNELINDLEELRTMINKFAESYENRLKADMVAMLTDMLIDVEEIASREQWCDYANDNCISRYDVEDLFQQKINALKADTEDQDV